MIANGNVRIARVDFLPGYSALRKSKNGLQLFRK